MEPTLHLEARVLLLACTITEIKINFDAHSTSKPTDFQKSSQLRFIHSNEVDLYPPH